ncbi:MAG: bifunctional 4'-phosphopantothenoylcysteine decarboxylase/phosphopantothenoylcysteine synthetase, partial [Chloroflexi bacterium]|nr:bifunctional 4'-phosphopantothenoylcysteine decarboxylase/phosphopantothenoylcysteine synthetase [Chloroflexota bacterium]
ITTPTSLTLPIGARVINVQTAQQMLEAVLKECAQADALIMAAAVADFRPKQAARNKLKKQDGIPQIELEATEDILEAVSAQKSRKLALSTVEAKRPRITVGFAAESRDLLENASEKLRSKHLDFIAANDISAQDAGFNVETNRVTLLFADGKKESLPLMNKTEVAEAILEHVAALLE